MLKRYSTVPPNSEPVHWYNIQVAVVGNLCQRQLLCPYPWNLFETELLIGLYIFFERLFLGTFHGKLILIREQKKSFKLTSRYLICNWSLMSSDFLVVEIFLLSIVKIWLADVGQYPSWVVLQLLLQKWKVYICWF